MKLTQKEQNLVNKLGSCYNDFLALDSKHPSDTNDTQKIEAFKANGARRRIRYRGNDR